jgi:hypothetical protein
MVTKDERTMIVKPTTNNRYTVYNTDIKAYELLLANQLDDFITASATNIVVCYNADDTAQPIPQLQHSTLNMDNWTLYSNLDSRHLFEKFNQHMSNVTKPLQIGPYQLQAANIVQLLEPTYKLNDEQLNAHLHVSTTLLNGVILLDSIAFTKYHRRGFRKASEFLHRQWFTQNIILVPIHHSNHWFLFVVDIPKKTIILFDSLPSVTTPHEAYLTDILQLIRIHHFYMQKSKLHFDDWTIINNFPDWRQDDDTSCGIRCALFARSYVTSMKYPPINSTNITTFRTQFALHLLQHKTK